VAHQQNVANRRVSHLFENKAFWKAFWHPVRFPFRSFVSSRFLVEIERFGHDPLPWQQQDVDEFFKIKFPSHSLQ
jgi:hypothetical protein